MESADCGQRRSNFLAGDGKPDLLLINLRTIGTHHCDQTVGEEAAQEIERLRERVKELEADAERLDWLDANGSAVRLKGNSRRNLIIWNAVHVPSYRTIRHAIDQARGKGGCGEGAGL